MTFLYYLKDQLRLILLWFVFIFLTAFILWLTPNVSLNSRSLIYICFLGFLLLMIHLVFEYVRKKKWWACLEKNHTAAHITPKLDSADTQEELLYQNYFNELHQEHFILMNEIKKHAQEQKDYIDSWVHEIKIPLSSLNLISEVIEDDISEKRFNQLTDNLQRIDDYVEQVMYYSRLDDFSKDYLIHSYSLKKVVQKTVKQHANQFIKKGIRFSMTGDDYFILTDEKWLQFILNQLISNAVKYTPDGGSISVHLKKNSLGVWLSITDTGIGVPFEDIQRVFDKGFTGNNGRNEEVNSTGLGLYLAKNLTEKLGHQMYVVSVVDEGTTFQILFPHLNYYSDGSDETFIIA